MDHAKKDPTSYNKMRYPRPLRTVIWDSYIKTALIPLVVIELGFLAVYWYGSGIIYRDTMADGRQVSAAYMSDIARREAANMPKASVPGSVRRKLAKAQRETPT